MTKPDFMIFRYPEERNLPISEVRRRRLADELKRNPAALRDFKHAALHDDKVRQQWISIFGKDVNDKTVFKINRQFIDQEPTSGRVYSYELFHPTSVSV